MSLIQHMLNHELKLHISTIYVTCMIITIILIDTITSFIGEKVPILVYKQSSISWGICLYFTKYFNYLVEMQWIIVKRTHLIKKKQSKKQIIMISMIKKANHYF